MRGSKFFNSPISKRTMNMSSIDIATLEFTEFNKSLSKSGEAA